MKSKPSIRVIWYVKGPEDQSGLLFEQLRRMGFVHILKDFTPLMDVERRKGPLSHFYEGYFVLEFLAPIGLNSESWCEANADRMNSFGINAVVAPRWIMTDSQLLVWIENQRSKSLVDGMQ